MIPMKAKIIVFCVLIFCSQYLIADEAAFFWNIGNINLELSPLKYWFFSENETKKMTFLILVFFSIC